MSTLVTTPQLHVVGRAHNGPIYHSIRFADGSWAPSFSHVKPQENILFKTVGTAGAASGKLHLTPVSSATGILWHTIRFADGNWARFSNVNSQEVNSGLHFQDVDCAIIDENLHVITVENDGVLWHTIHFADGSWQSSFGNVNGQESNSGLRFKDVDCANVGNNLHVTAIGTDDAIYHTICFSNDGA